MGRKMSKRITFLSAIVTFLSFLYKGLLGYISKSIIIVATALSSLCVFFCKIIYVKRLNKSRKEKRHAYLLMGFILFIYGLLFLFVVLAKLSGLYDVEEKVYEGWQSTLLALVIVVMLILSIRGYRTAADRTDIMVLGLKEVGLATALSDLIVLEGLLDDYFVGHFDEDLLSKIHEWLSLGVSSIIILISIIMMLRFVNRTRLAINEKE